MRERQFGRSVGAVLVLIAAWLGWRGGLGAAAPWAVTGSLLVVLGTWWPSVLKPLSDLWWAIAAVLGYVNTRIILTILFVVIFVPMGLVWRLTRRDPLRLQRDRQAWIPYPIRYADRNHFRRMF